MALKLAFSLDQAAKSTCLITAGTAAAARMAMTASTPINSMSENPRRESGLAAGRAGGPWNPPGTCSAVSLRGSEAQGALTFREIVSR